MAEQEQAPLSPKQRLAKQYGAGFPEVSEQDGKVWRGWIESQRKRQEGPLRDKRMHWSRHRHFRHGYQWVSTRDGRTWREPQADVNEVRAVLNLIGPALDFRLGILSEQRPGFRYEAAGGSTTDRETAEAQQAVAEYYFSILRAWNVFLDAWYNAQTDGVSFIHVYIDPNAGPTREDIDLIPQTDERYPGLVAQGYTVDAQGNVELPYSEEGMPAPPDSTPRMLYEGEIATRVLLAHEVVFDPEARSVNGPVDKARWAIVRRVRDVAQARLETGNPKLDEEQSISSGGGEILDLPMDRQMGWQRGLPPFPTTNVRSIDGVPEYLLWITPNLNEPGLEKGIWLRIVGNELVERGEELPGGIIPLARVTDGSADTNIFPRPVVSDWVGDQLAINALLSSLLKHARWFAGGRLLAPKGTLLEETYSNVTGSVVEYSGQAPGVFPNVPAGGEAWRLLDWLIKKLEDKTGWNDIARGQLTGSSGASASDISGRAVLATRELFERAFGPVVRAAAEGATEWAQIIIRYAQWLFETPRLIPAVGGRGDLAKRIDSEKLGDVPRVYCDPETMMPLPRALKQQLLEEQLDKGRISQAVYQKRSAYADVRDLQMGDTAQWQRAQWINTEIEERWEELAAMAPEQRFSPQGGIPILWQDVGQVGIATATPAEGAVGPASQMPAYYQTVHKPALQEIILDNRKPWPMRAVALERWGIYDQLERCVNDPTGATQVPVMVLGTPPDKLMLMQMAAQAAVAPEGQPGAGGAGGTPAPSPTSQAAPATSAAPEMSGTTPAASQLTPPKLGEFGNVERQA